MIAVLLMSLSSAAMASAQTNPNQASEKQIIDANASGPAFLNAYWINPSAATGTAGAGAVAAAKKEVAPGDGASTLAVVLVNRGFSDITGVRGTLVLPQGFSANGMSDGSSNAVATFDNVVEAGQTFTLYFDLDVSDKTHVGTYGTSLDVEFSNVLEIGAPRHATLSVTLRLTGKVVLDPVAVTRNLVPGVSNDVDIAIRNTGSAPATGVIVTLSGITINSGAGAGPSTDSNGSIALRPQITSFGTNTFTVGTIAANSTAMLTTSLFPNIAAGGNTAGIQLQVTYNDATGNTKTLTPTIGVIVLQNAPSIIGVSASSGGNETDNRIIAGRTDDFALRIANKGGEKITSAVVTMESTSSSINILGDSKWAVDEIAAGSQARLGTKVFAATSLIGNPATFDVTIDYLLDGSPKIEKYVIGTYVDGDISLRIYDLAVNFVGGTPTLVGNILNEGNTAALFTTIELVPQAGQRGNFTRTGTQENPQQQGNVQEQGNAGQFQRNNGTRAFAPPAPQYLGDLTANSPLPFSIPLSFVRTQGEGAVPVTLKITYKDSLRNSHEFVSSEMAAVSQQQATPAQAARNQQGRGMMTDIIIIIIVGAIAGAAIAVFVVRKKRRKSQKAIQKGENIEDILEKPSEEPRVPRDRHGGA
jgi:hypothetical protein